jgi:hypothetical protein
MTELTPFTIGQRVKIDLEAMVRSNHGCKTPNYPSDDYLGKVRRLVAAQGPYGVVSEVFPPGYELTVWTGGHAFSMKGHSWCHPLTQAEQDAFDEQIRVDRRKTEKVVFLRRLTDSIVEELVTKVDSGAIPDSWDGHELRQLLADKFAFEVGDPMREKRSRRVKDYHKTVIANNL